MKTCVLKHDKTNGKNMNMFYKKKKNKRSKKNSHRQKALEVRAEDGAICPNSMIQALDPVQLSSHQVVFFEG